MKVTQTLLSYAQLAFPESQEMNDMISEGASMAVESDASARISALRFAVSALMTYDVDSAWLATADPVKTARVCDCCEKGRGLQFDDDCKSVFTSFDERMQKDIEL